MPHVFRIETDPAAKDGALLHRILNFKEEIQRLHYRTEWAEVEDPGACDHASQPVVVRVKSKRGLAEFQDTINRAMETHGVSGVVRVIRIEHA